MWRIRSLQARTTALGVALLLAALQALPPLLGFAPSLAGAAGIENQRDPTTCEAFRTNWTDCEAAFASDDLYAYANNTGGGGSLTAGNTTTSSGDSSSFSFSHGSQDYNLLIVRISTLTTDSDITTAPTYGGQSLTEIVDHAPTHGKARVWIWYLLDPPNGTNTLSGSFTVSNKYRVAATNLDGVHPATPVDTGGVQTATCQSGTTCSVSVASDAGDTVVDVLGTLSPVLTVGSDQTQDYNANYGGGASERTGGSHEAGPGPVTMSWTKESGKEAGLAAVNINAATTWYARDSSSTVSACSGVNLEILDPAGSAAATQDIAGGNLYCWHTAAMTTTIQSGDWAAFVELRTTGGGSASQIRITIDITSAGGTVQETVADCTTGNDPNAEIGCTAAGVPSKTLSNQRVRLRLEKTTGTSVVNVRFNGTKGGDADTRISVPAFELGGNESVWTDFGFGLNATDVVEKVEVGVEWFRVSGRPILNATVSWDGGTTWASNQMATNKSADDDTLEWLNFTSATSWTPSKLSDANFRVSLGTNDSGGRLDYLSVRVQFDTVPAVSNFRLEDGAGASKAGEQLDVDTIYTFLFNVTDQDGWSDIGDDGSVSLRLWYDGNASPELTFAEQTTGANYRIVLTYQDTSDPSTASPSEWSVTEGRATYDAASSSLTSITSGATTIGYEFQLALRLGFQVKHAFDPTDSTTGSYNDRDSWNAEVVASDGTSSTTLQAASTGEHMEFGVFQYTYVSIAGDWTVSLGPGDTQSTNTVTVTRRSNDDLNMTVWFVTHLEMGSNTIDIGNVQILAAADPDDSITADTPFAGPGEANAVHILGSASVYFAHSTDTDEDTTTVQFSVTVPLGSAAGTYTAQLTIRIEQRPP